jgi:hypothetical protein
LSDTGALLGQKRPIQFGHKFTSRHMQTFRSMPGNRRC